MKKIGILTILILTITLSNVEAATLRFDPTSSNFKQECSTEVDLLVDLGGQSSNASDVKINFNPAHITIKDSDPDLPGKQVKEGTAYESYFINDVDDSNGEITVATGSFIKDATGTKIYVTIEFTSKPGVTSTSFNIDYAGSGVTTDSNIADTTTSLDLLTGVQNGNYNFIVTTCVNDNLPPSVTFLSPTPYQTGFPLDGNVAFRITENLSGINLASLIFQLNGLNYAYNSPGVTFTGNGTDYTFTIDPAENFEENEAIILNITGNDFAGNSFSDSSAFNIPIVEVPEEEEPPEEEPEEVTPLVCEEPVNSTTTFIDRFFGIDGQNILEDTPLEGTIVDEVVGNLGVDEVNTVVGGTVIFFSLLPIISLLNTPWALINIASLLIFRRTRKPWGLVIDAVTGKPIAFAVCRLYKVGTLYVTEQTISDLEGRYGFITSPGQYRLEISQSGYKTFSKDIAIAEKENRYVYDVNLMPVNLNEEVGLSVSKKILKQLKELFERFKKYLFILGALIAILSFIAIPNTLNTIILVLYALMIILTVLTKVNFRSKQAAVVDSETNLRIPFAIVKIFNMDTWELIDSVVTNSNGNFDFFGEPGEYALLVAARGYKFPSDKNKDQIVSKYNSLVKATLTTGKNRIVLYVDSTYATVESLVNETSEKSNLPTPFN